MKVLVGFFILVSTSLVIPASNFQLSLLKTSLCPSKPINAFCNNDTQQECPKDKDSSGCFHGNYCYPKTIIHGSCLLNCPPVCEHDEIYCKGPLIGDCPLPDTCVKKFDKDGQCRNFCPIGCNLKTEIICPGVRGHDGCKLEDTCVPKGEVCPKELYDEYACEITVQHVCKYSETLCPGGYDPHGCPKPSFCLELNNRTAPALNGYDGCPTYCPATCLPGVEILCPTIYDEDGCSMPPLCKSFISECPPTEYEKGTGCPIPTKTQCDDYNLQQICHKEPIKKSFLTLNFPNEMNLNPASYPIFENDPLCNLGHMCVDKIDIDSNCPIYCPVHCDNDTEMHCPGMIDENGCMGPATCVPQEEKCPNSQYDLKGCYIHDEVKCSHNEVKCHGIRDQKGCRSKHSCISKGGGCACPKEEFDEHGCPLDIPHPICDKNQLKCHKGESHKGCDLGYECIPAEVGGCPNVCPPNCKEDEQYCKIPILHKHVPSICPRAHSYQCLLLRDSRNCLLPCPSQCELDGFFTCPPIYDSDGCQQGPQTCTNDTSTCVSSPYDSEGCPIFDQITKCYEYYQLCEGGLDSKGCPRMNTCLALETPDGEDVFCPVICPDGFISCSQGTYFGISLGEVCIPADGYAYFMPYTVCDTHCPAACEWSKQKACSGGYNRATGCPHQDVCVPKETYCTGIHK